MNHIDENREIKGFWWRPNNPEFRLFGILTLKRGQESVLETFSSEAFGRNQSDLTTPVLHGQDEHGKAISLLFVGPASISCSFGLTKRSYHPGYVVFGIALESTTSLTVNEVQLWIQHLYGWAGITGFIHDSHPQDERVIRFRRPKDVYYRINDTLELGIGLSSSVNSGTAEQSIHEDVWISFRSEQGLSLNRCRKLWTTVRMLLHFAVLERVYPVKIMADKEGHGYSVGDRWVKQEIEIWSTELKEPKTELPFEQRWAFQFKDFKDRFAGFFGDWLKYVEQYREALGCYSSTIYHSLTNELAHLSLTQALDAYHGQKFCSHDNHDFKIKIRELTEPHAKALEGLIDDIDAFVEQVHATRNYYTHHNPSWLEKGKVAAKADLYRLNEKIKLIFQMSVLTDIGVPATRFGILKNQFATSIIDFE